MDGPHEQVSRLVAAVVMACVRLVVPRFDEGTLDESEAQAVVAAVRIVVARTLDEEREDSRAIDAAHTLEVGRGSHIWCRQYVMWSRGLRHRCSDGSPDNSWCIQSHVRRWSGIISVALCVHMLRGCRTRTKSLATGVAFPMTFPTHVLDTLTP